MRIGREGSSDRVIMRLDRARGLYFSTRVGGIRLRVALGPSYTPTFFLGRTVQGRTA